MFKNDDEREKYYENLRIDRINKHEITIEKINIIKNEINKELDKIAEDKYVKLFIELFNRDSVKEYRYNISKLEEIKKKEAKENKEFEKDLKIYCSHRYSLLIEEKNTSNKCYCLKCKSIQLLSNYRSIINIGRIASNEDIKNIQYFYDNLVLNNFTGEEIINKIESTFTEKTKRK